MLGRSRPSKWGPSRDEGGHQAGWHTATQEIHAHGAPAPSRPPGAEGLGAGWWLPSPPPALRHTQMPAWPLLSFQLFGASFPGGTQDAALGDQPSPGLGRR